MESLVDNRPLLYSLAGAGGFVVMLALGTMVLSKCLCNSLISKEILCILSVCEK